MSAKKTSAESETETVDAAAEKSDGESAAASAEAAPPERRKTPLEMVRERQAKQQASRSGIGKKGAKGASSGGGAAAGADGVTKPVQVKRQMGG